MSGTKITESNQAYGGQLKVLVCDDEPLARARLNRMLDEFENYSAIGEASNGKEAIEKTCIMSPDILLLDIQMPEMDGIETAQRVNQLPCPPAIIFCTAFGEHALAALQANAVDYLLKPVRAEDLKSALKKAQRLNKVQLSSISTQLASFPISDITEDKQLSIKTHRGIELIALKDIRYFKADQKYVIIRNKDGSILWDESLKNIEKKFSEDFLRIHRNALVAKRYIIALECGKPGFYSVRIQGIKEQLPVSRRHCSKIKQFLLNRSQA